MDACVSSGNYTTTLGSIIIVILTLMSGVCVLAITTKLKRHKKPWDMV
jgi:hypothetical protein